MFIVLQIAAKPRVLAELSRTESLIMFLLAPRETSTEIAPGLDQTQTFKRSERGTEKSSKQSLGKLWKNMA